MLLSCFVEDRPSYYILNNLRSILDGYSKDFRISSLIDIVGSLLKGMVVKLKDRTNDIFANYLLYNGEKDWL